MVSLISDGWSFVKGIFELGTGFYAYLQVRALRSFAFPLLALLCRGAPGVKTCVHMCVCVCSSSPCCCLICTCFQSEVSLSELVEGMTVDLNHVNKRVKAVQKDITGLREDLGEVQNGIRKILDNQAYLAALFKEGEDARGW